MSDQELKLFAGKLWKFYAFAFGTTRLLCFFIVDTDYFVIPFLKLCTNHPLRMQVTLEKPDFFLFMPKNS